MAGDPILAIKASPVSELDLNNPKIQNILTDMRQIFKSSLTPVIGTKRFYKGLSAPQIGHSLQIIGYQIQDSKLIKDNKLAGPVPLSFLINPQLTFLTGKTTTDYEFCESVPNYSALVKRSSKIKIAAIDEEGKPVVREFGGILARVIQHEYDHLQGVLHTEKMEPKTLRHDSYVGKYEIYKK